MPERRAAHARARDGEGRAGARLRSRSTTRCSRRRKRSRRSRSSPGSRAVTEEGGLKVAPTTLEQYARCPFAFFMGHVLGVEPMDEPEEALLLSPLEKGSLYHEVLERVPAEGQGGRPLPPDAPRHATRCSRSRSASRARASGACRASSARGNSRSGTSLTGLSLWLARGGARGPANYEPSYFEARFGGRPRPGDDETLSSEEGVPFEAEGGVRVTLQREDRPHRRERRRQPARASSTTRPARPAPAAGRCWTAGSACSCRSI